MSSFEAYISSSLRDQGGNPRAAAKCRLIFKTLDLSYRLGILVTSVYLRRLSQMHLRREGIGKKPWRHAVDCRPRVICQGVKGVKVSVMIETLGSPKGLVLVDRRT